MVSGPFQGSKLGWTGTAIAAIAGYVAVTTFESSAAARKPLLENARRCRFPRTELPRVLGVGQLLTTCATLASRMRNASRGSAARARSTRRPSLGTAVFGSEAPCLAALLPIVRQLGGTLPPRSTRRASTARRAICARVPSRRARPTRISATSIAKPPTTCPTRACAASRTWNDAGCGLFGLPEHNIYRSTVRCSGNDDCRVDHECDISEEGNMV